METLRPLGTHSIYDCLLSQLNVRLFFILLFSFLFAWGRKVWTFLFTHIVLLVYAPSIHFKVAPTSYCWFHSKMLYAVAKPLVPISPSSYHFWNPTFSWSFCPLTPRFQCPVPISTFFPPTALALPLLCEVINVDRCSRLAHWWGCHVYFSLVAFFSPNNYLRFPPTLLKASVAKLVWLL